MAARIPLPSYCRVHGLFPTYPPFWGDDVEFTNCSATCPVCNEFCPVLSGRYDAAANVYRAIDDGGFSLEVIRALAALAQKVEANAISLDEAKVEAAKISPKAARLFDLGTWGENAQATLLVGVLMAAATIGAAVIMRPSAPRDEPFVEKVVRDMKAAATSPVVLPPPMEPEPPLEPRARPRPKTKRR